MTKVLQTSEYQEAKRIGESRKPTKPELFLNKVLQTLFRGQYKYVGDFSHFIGEKNPDFISTNGNKKVIEMFGNHWHSEEITGFAKHAEQARRERHFARHGYDCLVVWENELFDIIHLTLKLSAFHNRKEVSSNKAQSVFV